MNKISAILSKDNEWKKALDGSDDTYWAVQANVQVELKLLPDCTKISFDFQKGFQPKRMRLNNRVYSLTKNTSTIEVAIEDVVDCAVPLIFLKAYDPYGRIYIYHIKGE